MQKESAKNIKICRFYERKCEPTFRQYSINWKNHIYFSQFFAYLEISETSKNNFLTLQTYQRKRYKKNHPKILKFVYSIEWRVNPLFANIQKHIYFSKFFAPFEISETSQNNFLTLQTYQRKRCKKNHPKILIFVDSMEWRLSPLFSNIQKTYILFTIFCTFRNFWDFSK